MPAPPLLNQSNIDKISEIHVKKLNPILFVIPFVAFLVITFSYEYANQELLFFMFFGGGVFGFILTVVLYGLATAYSRSNSTRQVEDIRHELVETIEDEEQLKSRTSELEYLNKMLTVTKEKVESEKAKDEAIFESIGEGMVVTDEKGQILIANKAASEILGCSSAEMIGKVWESDLPKEEDAKSHPLTPENSVINRVLQSGKKVSGDYLYYKDEIHKVPVQVTCSPVFINKRLTGAVVVFRDLTKEREIDTIKNDFISLASHQLRTPLSAIRWFGEMLLKGDAGELSKEQKEFVVNISESTTRMIELVNALLNISRMEAGRVAVDPKPTSMTELVESIVTEIKPIIDNKKLKLNIVSKDQLPKINVDPNLIRQVYMNLLSNSIKYTPSGGTVTVSLYLKGEDVCSSVQDSGYGIPANEHKKVFQKFYRGGNIIKEETEGTGLGLYLVKSIVESSNGKIWFESSEGKGTTFTFALPLAGMVAKKGEVTLDTYTGY